MLSNALQLLVMIVVFVIVLAACIFTTKWMAKSGAIQTHTTNIRVLETYKIAQNKYLQIVMFGDRYYAIGVSKDNITYLAELTESQLDLSDDGINESGMTFKDIMDRLRGKEKK